MRKFLNLIILFTFTTSVCFAQIERNTINPNEFPNSENVLPQASVNPDFVISGSVEKNIDMTLENCIRLALGNNPEIKAAFQDILAADARIKQVWSNYFPTISWQTGYTG